jgi:site-specific recombinase XerD
MQPSQSISTGKAYLPVVLQDYQHWLDGQPLSSHTRRAYLTQVHHYLTFLTTHPAPYGEPLKDENARDYAVADFKTYLKTEKNRRPATVNLSLAALDHFYRFLGMSTTHSLREESPKLAPHSLTPAEQKHFLRMVKSKAEVRDRALVLLLLYTGLRLGECVALNRNDVSLAARQAQITIRAGKGNRYRQVPLNNQVREALLEWDNHRRQNFEDTDLTETAFFLSRLGRRISPRGVDLRLRSLAAQAGLPLSAHTLRHTCLTNLVRGGHDLVLVAEIAGHKRLETTRRYSLPSAQDRENAMQSLEVDY